MLFPFHDDNPTRRTPLVTMALIAVNVVSFLGVQRLSTAEQQMLAYRRGFVPAWISQWPDPKPIEVSVEKEFVDRRFRRVVAIPQNVRLEPASRQVLASLFTCMFLHGSWMHLIGNMWFLWIFGNNVEDRLGGLLFLILYLGGGLLGSGGHWLQDPGSITPVIGASGAVATVLGAYAVTWPWARVRTLVFLFVFITIVDLPALMVLGVWFLIQLLEGTRQGLVQGVAWWAHIGGFVAGALLMPVFRSLTTPPRGRPWRDEIIEATVIDDHRQ